MRPGSPRVGTVLWSRVLGTGALKAVSVDSSLLDNTLVGLSSVSADLRFGTQPPPVYLQTLGEAASSGQVQTQVGASFQSLALLFRSLPNQDRTCANPSVSEVRALVLARRSEELGVSH